MWKKIVLRIWMENKGVPLCWKIPVLLLIIFAGTLLRGFPYMILAVLVVPFMEYAGLPASAIEDFVPRTARQRKKMDAGESVLIAGIYTLAFALGYVLVFCLCEGYFWDRETVFFLIKATVFVFLGLFNLRMWLIQTVISCADGFLYFSCKEGETSEDKFKKLIASMYRNLYGSLGPVLYLLVYAMGKFGGVGFFSFLAGRQWKIALAADGIFLAVLCIQTVKILKQGEKE